MPKMHFPSDVIVREYDRVRFGKREHVRKHWRSFPRRLI